MTLQQLRRVRWAVRATLTLGVAASVAANVLHARNNPVSEAIAAWPPLALLLTIELISRVPVHRPMLAGARMVATGGIAAIAAWVSYWHMAGVTSRYGESGGAQYLLPLSVDGLVVVASVSLVELAGRLRTGEQPARDEPSASALLPAELPPAPSTPDTPPPTSTSTSTDSRSRPTPEPAAKVRIRRPPQVTRAMAAQLLASKPRPTRAQVAAQLGITPRRLRDVLADPAPATSPAPADRVNGSAVTAVGTSTGTA